MTRQYSSGTLWVVATMGLVMAVLFAWAHAWDRPLAESERIEGSVVERRKVVFYGIVRPEVVVESDNGLRRRALLMSNADVPDRVSWLDGGGVEPEREVFLEQETSAMTVCLAMGLLGLAALGLAIKFTFEEANEALEEALDE